MQLVTESVAGYLRTVRSGGVSEEGGRVVLYKEGSWAAVTLTGVRRHNVLDMEAWRRLAVIFADLASDRDVRAIIVCGAGEDAFSAGADVAEFAQVRSEPQVAIDYDRAIEAALHAIMTAPTPVIAAVNGLAVGGGCEIAAACDIRVASAQAKFGLPIGKLGVMLGPVETRALLRLLGPGKLKWMVYSGEFIAAALAHQMGLVEVAVPVEDFESSVGAVVDSILRCSPTTLHALKQSIEAQQAGRTDTLNLTEAYISTYTDGNLVEGVAAFLGKRAPRFEEARQG